MAWEISITDEGWSDIEEELYNWDKKALIQALCDDYFEQLEKQGKAYETCKRRAAKKKYFLEQYPCFDALVRSCYEKIREHSTCDNGGNGYWIDREGYHQVYTEDKA